MKLSLARWSCHLLLVALLWMTLHRPVLVCQLDSCNMVLREPQGQFSSPCYPQEYPKSMTCRWSMLAPSGYVVQLHFLDFQLEEAAGCIYDHVMVNTSSAAMRFCGPTASGLTLNSTSNLMELSFSSDFSVQKRGFLVGYKHVAVALRSQKVTVTGGNGQFAMVAGSVALPVLSHLTVCFEVSCSNQRMKETIFTYQGGAGGGAALSLGTNGGGMELVVDGQVCPLLSALSASELLPAMVPLCLAWSSVSGRASIYLHGLRTASCTATKGRTVPTGGQFRIGGQNSITGEMYNFRLWDYAMTEQQLASLTCDTLGNIVDWDTRYWDIPMSLAQTDSTLSCICYPQCIHLTTAAPTNGTVPNHTPQAPSCDFPGLGCPAASDSITAITPATTNLPATNLSTHGGLFYHLSFVVDATGSSLAEADVKPSVVLWLDKTFQNWTHTIQLDYVSVSQDIGVSTSYTCQALLLYLYITNESVGVADVTSRMSSSDLTMSGGLHVQSDSIDVTSVDNCPEERPLHYRWPETRPSVSQVLPCFPNKELSAFRTCMISPLNYSSYWSAPDLRNCTDIVSIQVSADNAEEVAVQLADITNNKLSNDEVSQVVSKVQELVGVAKINTSLASTVVTILSNVMNTSDSLASDSGRALQTMDKLLHKMQFHGPSVSISSRHLALAISAIDPALFNGTSFSAFVPPNATNPQVDVESDMTDPLGQVKLPASLLSNISLSPSEWSSLSRVNFMFFSKTNFFQSEQGSFSLNSFVVASSVGNISISNLLDPVEITISHLYHTYSVKPVCMFWDFKLNDGAGGWNKEGCMASPASTNNRTICLCDHLTHFGVLMDISGAAAQIDESNNRVLTFITYIGCGISAIFSAATLLTYIAFEKLRRDYPSKILMNLSTSLLFLNMVFLLDGWLTSLNTDWLCVSVAIFLHYFLLTSFTWMGLESIHMYIALVKVFNTYIRRYILKFCVLGWGLPAVMVGIVVAVDRKSYSKLEYGQSGNGQASSEFCWIQSPLVFYTTCVGYFCVVFLLNVAMFIVVMLQICGRNGKRSNRTLRDEVLRNLRSVVSLTFLLGMTWGFALFAWGPVNLAFMYLFSIFNSLQGLFIFIFHCAMKENVQKQWRRYLCCGPFRLADNSDWSKTATNNTKKASSDTMGKSLSESFSSSWASRAKRSLHPFSKRHTGNGYSSQTGPNCISSYSSSEVEPPPSSSSSSSILPVSQMIDKVKGYCSTRSDNFYKNIIMSDSFSHNTKF